MLTAHRATIRLLTPRQLLHWTFERVPELTYTVAAGYNVPLASGSELDFRVSYAYY